MTVGNLMNTKIEINIPSKTNILNSGVPVNISPKDHSWYQSILGDDAKEKGVYVIHHNGKIMYVGKTDGAKMTFGIRLRRHFQESAAGKHTYPRLRKLNNPPTICVSMYSLEKIKSLVVSNIKNGNDIHLIPLFEAALISAYKPEFQK